MSHIPTLGILKDYGESLTGAVDNPIAAADRVALQHEVASSYALQGSIKVRRG